MLSEVLLRAECNEMLVAVRCEKWNDERMGTCTMAATNGYYSMIATRDVTIRSKEKDGGWCIPYPTNWTIGTWKAADLQANNTLQYILAPVDPISSPLISAGRHTETATSSIRRQVDTAAELRK